MLTTTNAGALNGASPHNDNEGTTMKCKALRSFLHKGEVIEAGQIVDIHEYEAATLIRFGRLAEVSEDPAADLSAMKKDELLALAAERGIEANTTMKKDEIIALLQF